MRNKKRTVPSFGIADGLIWRIGVLIFVLWFVTMSLLTMIGAQQLQDQWVDHANQMTHLYAPDVDNLLPGEIEQQRIVEMRAFDTLGGVCLDLPLYIDPICFWERYQRSDASYETAVVFFENGQPVMTHGDYITCEYVYADSWTAGKETSDGYAYIDVGRLPSEDTSIGSWRAFSRAADIFRLTGYFEGNQFVLQELAGFSAECPALYKGKSLAQWDQERGLNWEVYYTNPLVQAQELICIYTSDLWEYHHMENRPITRLLMGRNEELKNILLGDAPHSNASHSLFKTVIITERSTVTWNGTYHKVMTAIRCYPLRTAMERLHLVYILSGLLCTLTVVLSYFVLKRRIPDPLQQIIRCGKQNMIPLETRYRSKWREPYLLEEIYITGQQELQQLRQENQQLKTALDYAENAEANRRQMVSNITHELKTPLAVISSYCEGLLTGIAPEKQEKYLNVIMEEADRMDTMVLEMLDLSRLEAGKVRLAQDPVELLDLTQSVLQKLQPLAEEKGLTVTFGIVNKSSIIADEGRMGQVITNLVSNAIKYSPEGGQILINLFQRNGNTYFSIENESPPLSEEALAKVWETFYRAEQSRTTKGTGLGLSICKAIIELHRGTCNARNTSTGVEFSFTLPG